MVPILPVSTPSKVLPFLILQWWKTLIRPDCRKGRSAWLLALGQPVRGIYLPLFLGEGCWIKKIGLPCYHVVPSLTKLTKSRMLFNINSHKLASFELINIKQSNFLSKLILLLITVFSFPKSTFLVLISNITLMVLKTIFLCKNYI